MNGLYDPKYEHDACGVGFVVNTDGTRSHAIIEKGIEVLKNLEHRGAIGADMNTGDGAGILFQIPDAFFRREGEILGYHLPETGCYGIGMIFMHRSSNLAEKCRALVEKCIDDNGLGFIGWREVPFDDGVIAGQAKDRQPIILQCLIDGKGLKWAGLERRLFIACE